MSNIENKQKWLWLTQSCHITKAKAIKLYDAFLSIDNIYDAKREDYQKLGFLKEEDIASLMQKDLADANERFLAAEKKGVFLLTRDDPLFPCSLFDISSHPSVLYCKGNIKKLKKDECISIVGSRTPQGYGKSVTSSLASSLGTEGFTIVSGMADGVDSIAHRAALECGAYTVAVLGCGPDVIYPRANFELYEKIVKNGMIITEYAPGVTPERFYFPERNKIVAALSCATVVTEAGLKSGSLITAEYAKKYSRHVFAVPGNVTSSLCSGSNELIKEGAHMATGAEDLLKILGKDAPMQKEKSASPSLSPKEKLIYDAISDAPKSIDEISAKTSLKVTELFDILLEMELGGMIQRSGADKYFTAKI